MARVLGVRMQRPEDVLEQFYTALDEARITVQVAHEGCDRAARTIRLLGEHMLRTLEQMPPLKAA